MQQTESSRLTLVKCFDIFKAIPGSSVVEIKVAQAFTDHLAG